MPWLVALSVRRPVMATVFSLVILVGGGISYFQLGVDQFPKIDFPIIAIATENPGASPADMERDVSDKLEAAVNTIEGIDELRSDSSEGFSHVTVQFVLEKNINVASQEVQQNINVALPDLPEGIDPPVVQKLDPDAAPILYLAVQAPGVSIKDISDYTDRVIRRRLESISGVGQVKMLGGQKRRINVDVDPLKMKALSMTPLEVAAAINGQNITLPGGRVDASREYISVRVLGRAENVPQIGSIIVRNTENRPVYLNEIAEVADGVEDVTTAAEWNGVPTVVLAIRKQSGSNTVAVVDALLARLETFKAELPPGYRVDVQRDASEVIRTSTHAVQQHLVLGSLFAALVVLVFLGNFRSTIIAALAIPTSIVGTFALMKVQGYTLNVMTLLALALAVGIVIDDAIVVLENIVKHIEEKGLPPRQAAVEGTKEIGPAVLATTLSLMAVFVPIAFIYGIPGRFLAPFGLTMAFAIGVSLFISFTLTPMLASKWLRAKGSDGGKKPILARLVDVVYRPIERGYMRLLGFCMAHKWVVVLGCFVAMGGCVPAVMAAKKGFIPIDDKAQFEVMVRLPEGRSVSATALTASRIATALRGEKEVAATLLTIGDDPAKTPNLARIYVKMVLPNERKISQDNFKSAMREKIVPNIPPGIKVTFNDVSEIGGGTSTAHIQYLIGGPSLDAMVESTDRILKRLKAIPGAVDVDTTLVLGKPELGVVVDRDRAADLGVQVMDVAQSLQYLVAGQKVSTYSEGGDSYDIWMRSSQDYRTDPDKLRLITVPSRKVGLVPLASVVHIVPGTTPTTIQRFGRQRQVTYVANSAPDVSEGGVATQVQEVLDDEVTKMPKGNSVRPQGQTKMMRETAVSFGLGLLASLVFMYLILAAQFESWLHPLTIILSLFVMLPFAVYSVLLFDIALDMFSLLGIFVLFGVVKKNAILQIDHTIKLREQGMSKHDAIMLANKDRLRPILMTTIAFVAGMIPLVTATGIGSGFGHSTASVVVGGQSLSLLLTLVGVPVMYSYFDTLQQGASRLVARFFKKSGDEAPPVANPGVAP